MCHDGHVIRPRNSNISVPNKSNLLQEKGLHFGRAASRFCLKVLRLDSDLNELNRLRNDIYSSPQQNAKRSFKPTSVVSTKAFSKNGRQFLRQKRLREEKAHFPKYWLWYETKTKQFQKMPRRFLYPLPSPNTIFKQFKWSFILRKLN